MIPDRYIRLLLNTVTVAMLVVVCSMLWSTMSDRQEARARLETILDLQAEAVRMNDMARINLRQSRTMVRGFELDEVTLDEVLSTDGEPPRDTRHMVRVGWYRRWTLLDGGFLMTCPLESGCPEIDGGSL